MTPEERLDTIEKLLFQQGEQTARLSEQIQKHDFAIRDLILVSRTTLTAVQELRDAQAATDDKLNILIETLDRIVRRLN